MIYVLAFIKTKPGMLSQALAIYREFVPQVLANEPGCEAYVPTTDFDLGLANQKIDECMLVVNERWKTIDDFKAHLSMPHTIEFRSKIKNYLDEPIAVRISQEAS